MGNDLRRLVEGPWKFGLYNVLQREHGIAFVPVGAVRTSRVLTYNLRILSTRHLSQVTNPKTAEELAYTLGVDSVRISRSRGEVLVEVLLPKRFHQPLPVSSLSMKGREWIALGRAVRGNQVLINLGGSRYPHALIAATTGGGKTTLMHLIVWQLIRHNNPDDVSGVVIDGKGGMDWERFRQFPIPHLALPVVTDMDEAKAVLAAALAEMEDRGKTGRAYPSFYIIIDEIRELLARTGGANGLVAEACQRLTQIGRGLNMHVLMTTQHPVSAVLGGSMTKANLPLRLVGRVLDANASNLATGQPDMRAHELFGDGDFIAVDGSTAHRFQVAWLDAERLELPRSGQYNKASLQLDLDLELARLVDMTDKRKKKPSEPPEMVAWAIHDWTNRSLDNPSASAIRDAFRIGMTRARGIRDYAKAVVLELEKLGLPLLATQRGVPTVGKLAVQDILSR